MGRRRIATTFLLVLVSGFPCLSAEDLPPLVFVSRKLERYLDVRSRRQPIERAEAGRLLVRERGGEIRVLVDAAAAGAVPDTPLDVMDPDVSYDASRIVFAGLSSGERAFRIYEIGADGNGLRRITRSDRELDLDRHGAAGDLFREYDDLDPCYLPDGRICFVSTRYPGVAPDNRFRTTNLYVVDPDGSNLHRITTERFGADTPTVEPSTGKIVYSRWWRTPDVRDGAPRLIPTSPGSPMYGNTAIGDPDRVLRQVDESSFAGVNNWFLSSINPDGTHLTRFSGIRLDRELTQAYRPSFLPGGEVLALFLPRTPYIGFPRGYGLRRYRQGEEEPVDLGGPQKFSAFAGQNSPFLYASAAGLADGRVLFTGTLLDWLRPDYGIFIQESGGGVPMKPAIPVYSDPGAAELDAVPLVAREVPPVIPDAVAETMAESVPRNVVEAFLQGGSFTFLVENIHSNAPVDAAVPHAPPVGHRLKIEFYMSPQRGDSRGQDLPILIRRIDVPADGRFQVDLPAGVPLFEVLRLPDRTIPQGRDGQVFHVGGLNFARAGQTLRCVGCHAGHSRMAVPEDPSWTNLAPSATVTAGSTRIEGRTPSAAFQPRNLVDRRTGGPAFEWAVGGLPLPGNLRFEWINSLQAKEIVLHGTRPGQGPLGARDQVIHALSLRTLLDGVEQQSVAVAREIRPEGTSVTMDPELEFDALEIAIRPEDVTGLYEGYRGMALAEVEVVARAVGESRLPAIPGFAEGDVNCDRHINLTDAVAVLRQLFLRGERLCCLAAADVTGDARVNLTDAIHLLGVMFGIGNPSPTPLRRCVHSAENRLGCDRDTCF